MPDYIAKAPWWAEIDGEPSLNHHRKEEKKKAPIDQWYDRGAVGPAATKYRKGACENCGAMTHKRKDCVERPRRRGAKFTNKDIAPDEKIQEVSREYDAKRDRWNGYDPASYKSVVEDYEAAEEARRKFREAQLEEQAKKAAEIKREAKKQKAKDEDDEFGTDDDSDEDTGDQTMQADQVDQTFDHKNRMTVRNLRIREDTAKYLLNLNPESAYYDPKTRSMRDAPEEGKSAEDLRFAGDNFARYSGDATNMQKLQAFAWQSAQRGHNVNVHSNPTAGELLHREFQQKRDVVKNKAKTSILEKYGGEEHLERLPQELLGGQTEHYVEYSRTGEIIKGQEAAKAKSKYPEDVFPNNHTSVWGSWYDKESGQWGFACCHSLISRSYCTGEAGKEANQASTASALLASKDEDAEPEEEKPVKSLAEMHRERMEALKDKKKSDNDQSREASADDLDKERLKRAVAEERRRKRMGEEEAWEATKKAKTDVTEEEMEAYRMSRNAFEDPMANYQDQEE